jgi:hypothetical protein
MAALTLSTTLLPNALVGVPYEASFAVSGTVAAHALTVSAGTVQTNKQALPSGLSYTADGRISGTPNVSGTFNLSVKLTDGTNTTDNIPLTLFIDHSNASVGANIERLTAGAIAA